MGMEVVERRKIMSKRLTNIARKMRGFGDPLLTNEVCEYIAELEAEKAKRREWLKETIANLKRMVELIEEQADELEEQDHE